MSGFEYTMVEGRRMKLLVGGPAERGPHPAILLAFHRHGFSPFTSDVVAEFSARGYVVAVPDLYHRCGDMPSEEAVAHRRDTDVLTDMAAGLEFLRRRPDLDSDRIIVAGHCMGGRIAFLTASEMPNAFRACLAYYSGGMFKPWGDPPSPFERLPEIRCPVAAFFGNDDDNPPPSEVDRIEAELRQAGIRYETHRYDGAGHGYMDRNRGRYHSHAASDSWAKTFEFLRAQGLAAKASVRPVLS